MNLSIQSLILVLHGSGDSAYEVSFTFPLFTFISSLIIATANHTSTFHFNARLSIPIPHLTTHYLIIHSYCISTSLFAFRIYTLESYLYYSISLLSLHLAPILYTHIRNVTHHSTICHYATTLRCSSVILSFCVYSSSYTPSYTLHSNSPLSSYPVSEMRHCI